MGGTTFCYVCPQAFFHSRCQVLSSSRPLEREKRDPGLGWSRVFQILAVLWEEQISGEFVSRLSQQVSVASRHSKQTTREALWTELCQLRIFSRRPKRSVNLPLLQISVVADFANQLETHLSRTTFMQTEISPALLPAAEDIYRRPLRQDKLLPHLLRRPCERRLKNCISLKCE